MVDIPSLCDHPRTLKRGSGVLAWQILVGCLFTAPTEVTDTDSSEVLIAPTGDLSRFGSFIETSTPLPRARRIRIKVAHAGEIFSAYGKVVYHTNEGMGIAFTTVEKEERVAKSCQKPQRLARQNKITRES
jgi:hypothetical protein